MSFTTNGIIEASDYNTRIGNPTGTPANANKALQPFASAIEATEKAAALVGVGYGKRGYGQTSYTLPNKSIGDIISHDEWTDLANALLTIADHQGTDASALFKSSDTELGDLITAFIGGAKPELDTVLSAIDVAALNYENDSGLSMSLISDILNNTRASAWTTTITHEARFTFSSADNARFFFNSGGEIRLNLDHPNVSGPQNVSWNDVLNNKVGVVSMGAASTNRSGTAGLVSDIGYYDLTNSYQTIYNGANIGTGAYSSNDVYVQALVGGTTENGATGSYIQFRITLTDAHTGSSDVVSGGTNAIWDAFKATVELSNIETPIGTVISSF